MKIFTVSEIVQDAKVSLEAMYPSIWVEGEISNVKLYPSGHFYFSLKDNAAQVSAVMFSSDFARIRFRPENGLHVIVQGRLSIYPARGQFQLISVGMEPKGKGALQLAFEQLKAKLEKEGLFDPARKKPIPLVPDWIGLVTSTQGAALRDMLSILNRRFASVRILIAPVRVQGEGAAEEIVAAIRQLNRDFPALDALLVGRGGGSMEDLWAFNEEHVARAIASSRIPVISCVGHETDFTIADFVADLRAPTPSAAAELVIQNKADLFQQLSHLLTRLTSFITYRLADLDERLQRARESRMLAHPLAWIDERLQDLDGLLARLAQSASNRTEHWEKDLNHLLQKLHLLSPLAILSRGYAIAWTAEPHRLLKSARQVHKDTRIEVQLHEGKVYAQIERTEI